MKHLLHIWPERSLKELYFGTSSRLSISYIANVKLVFAYETRYKSLVFGLRNYDRKVLVQYKCINGLATRLQTFDVSYMGVPALWDYYRCILLMTDIRSLDSALLPTT